MSYTADPLASTTEKHKRNQLQGYVGKHSYLLLIATSLLLASCVSVGSRTGSAPSANPASTDKAERAARSAQKREDASQRQQQAMAAAVEQDKDQSNPAVQSLLANARSAQKDGTPERANLLLERALRIDPDDANIYLELARLRASSGNYAGAIGFAERGLSLNPGEELSAQLKELIKSAKQEQAGIKV